MIRSYATSDVGKVRELNEDYFSVSYPEDAIQLFVLADGMGGYNGGEIASQLAVNSVKNYISSNFENAKQTREELLELVKSASQYANMVVYEKSQSSEELKKMGTTLDICLIYQGKAYIAHIGDSRIYRYRKGFFRKLTKDHTYVQELVDVGKITKEESINHPEKNMLMKALGVAPFIEPDVMIKGFMKDDIYLMCSDGLTNMVSEDNIRKIIDENPVDSTKLLVQAANDGGGVDNVTAIIIR